MPAKFWNPVFMTLGNSMTMGLPGSGGVFKSYRQTFSDDMIAAGLTVAKGLKFIGSLTNGSGSGWIQHEGHPGYGTNLILPELVSWLRLNHPGVIIIWLGVNDIGDGIEAGAPARMSTILDIIRSFDPLIMCFVCSVTITDTSADPTFEAKRLVMNTAFASVVATKLSQGHRVSFIDLEGLFVLADVVPAPADGIHLTDAGYVKLGHILSGILIPYISKFL